MSDELYKQYGQLMIQAEVIQSQIQAVKRQIAEEINKKNINPKKDETDEDKK